MGGASADVSLRATARDLLRARRDPYAVDSIWLARPIAGLVSTAAGLLGVTFLPFAPPTAAIGTAGWAVAAAIVVCTFAGAARLFDARREGAVDPLYPLTYPGIAPNTGMIWLGRGGGCPP